MALGSEVWEGGSSLGSAFLCVGDRLTEMKRGEVKEEEEEEQD